MPSAGKTRCSKIEVMPPRIAIPVPHSGDPDYAARALPQYEQAVAMAGGEPVAIPLDKSPGEVMKLMEKCDAILLPGSRADVNPETYDQARQSHTADADNRRYTVDALLLQDAYKMRKPVLGICYGLQMLNVHRSGTLVQHIPDYLSLSKRELVNHSAGRVVRLAHNVDIDPVSRLAEIIGTNQAGNSKLTIPVNSSHHQSADVIGHGLRVSARCTEDGIIEAVEGVSPDHFVLAVQWHPERSIEDDKPSRAIFRAFVEAARSSRKALAGQFDSV